jgi:ribosomal protein L28
MASCYLCEKKTAIGRSQKHRRGVAGKRWMYRTFLIARVFKANLQKKTIEIDGQTKQVTMCAKCIKRLKFDAKQAMVTA